VVRDAHGKGHGLVRGEVETLKTCRPSTHGIYARPGVHEAMVRFSNGTSHIGEDRFLPAGSGIGLRSSASKEKRCWRTSRTVGAVRHGDYVAKVRVAPVQEFADRVVRRKLDVNSAGQVFRPALVEELRERPYEFDIQVQLCTDLTHMPVEDGPLAGDAVAIRDGREIAAAAAGHRRR
jgi:hypothetical protein